MEKNFLFVNLIVKGGYYSVNHGIAYLIPLVKKCSYKVSLINLTREMTNDEFREKVKEINPSIIAFSMNTSMQLKYLIKYSKSIENFPDLLKICGGIGATLAPELILNKTSLDGVTIGEAEKSIVELLTKVNKGDDIFDTKGFYWKKDGKIKKNEILDFIKDLSTLDFPDYSLFDRQFVISPNGHLNIILTRGCPYSCTYCSNEGLRNVYPCTKGYFRIPSVEYCIRLIKSLIQQYPETKYIWFDDQLLTSNKEWFLSFAEEYPKKIGIPYRMNIRIESIDPEIAEAIKKSGCTIVYIGLESGNEELRKQLLNRHYTNEELITKSKMIKDVGVEVYTFNMLGFPFETKQQMEDTLKLNEKIKPDWGICTFFYPFPGTKLYTLCEKEGLLLEDGMGLSNYNTKPAIKLPNEADVIEMQKKLMDFFYKQLMKGIFKRFYNETMFSLFLPLIRGISKLKTNNSILINNFLIENTIFRLYKYG